EVYAVDHFCDQDLSWYTRDRIRFETLDELPDAIEEMCSRYPIDCLVPASGAESLRSPVPVLGTNPETALQFLDKLRTSEFFDEMGIVTPRLLTPGDFPAMLKPRMGSGGWRNRVVTSRDEKICWQETFGDPPAITQEVVQGIPASVCCVTDGKSAVAVAVNAQLLRGEEDAEYGFCGSITPLLDARSGILAGLAEKIAGGSGCRGTIGIDFVLGEKPWAIEVNPRFQATVDTIEMSTGINLFSAHTQACEGRLPLTRPEPIRHAVRKILFAGRDLVIREDLSRLSPAVADIPWPGAEFEEGQAVVSVFGWGDSNGEALLMLDKHMKTVRQYIG
ncbi:MAG: ATP-grasp domain-containing protein, partial [Methanolinea sp.]|nr:ATP-grasp domain-containing protein [Methanolinea sp.]